MPNAAVIRNSQFTLVSEFARPDSKKRLTLGAAAFVSGATAFNIYRNAVGQIVLDPVKAIPAAEAWLWENPKALAAVRQGLKESAEGKTLYLGSFADDAK
jgi:hypothetical protein